MYGAKNEKAQASIKDTELLQQFMEVDKMNGEDKKRLKTLLMPLLPKANLNS
jgi:hypothetical protein